MLFHCEIPGLKFEANNVLFSHKKSPCEEGLFSVKIKRFCLVACRGFGATFFVEPFRDGPSDGNDSGQNNPIQIMTIGCWEVIAHHHEDQGHGHISIMFGS